MFGSKAYSCFVITTVEDGRSVEQMLDVRNFDMGRSFDVALQFADPSISKVHARIAQKQGRILLEDMGSRNGTFVDGKRVEPRGIVEVTESSKIILGQSRITLHVRLLKKVMVKSAIESEDLKQSDKFKLMEILDAARTEAKRTVELAQTRALESERESIARHQEKLESAIVQAEKVISQANEESEKTIEKAASQVTEMILSANGDADRIVRDSMTKAQGLVDEAQKKVHELEKQLGTLEAYLEQKKQEVVALQDQHKAKEAEMRDWQKNFDSMKTEAQREQERIRENLSSIETAFYDNYSSLQLRRQAKEDEILQLETAKHKYESEGTDLKAKIDTAQKMLEESLRKSQEQNAALERLESTKTVFENMERETREKWHQEELEHARQFQEKQGQFQLEIQTSTRRLDGLRSEVSGSETQLHDLQQRLNNLKIETEEKKKGEDLELAKFREGIQAHKVREEAELAVFRERLKAEHHLDIVELGKTKEQLRAQKDLDQAELGRFRDELKVQKQRDLEELGKYKDQIKQQKEHELVDLGKYKDQMKLEKEKALQELSRYREEVKEQKQQEQNSLSSLKEQLKLQKQQSGAEVSLFENELKGKKHEKVNQLQKEIEGLQADSMRQHLQYKNELSARVDRYRSEITRDVMAEVELLTGHLFKPTETERITNAIQRWISKSGESESTHKSSLEYEIPKSAARAKLRYTAYGLLAGGLFSVLGAYFFSYYYGVELEIKTAKEPVVVQAPKPIFKPDQTPELRETLAESVLYTQDYSSLYSDPGFQSRWRKKVSEYLLKQWRIPEEKAIEVISLQLALIEGVENQKKSIDPDHVEKDVEKLKQFEEESLKNLKAILGTKSKYEAYRNFDREFFKKEQQNRLPASQ